jgi:site-specific recombinase XerC
MIPLVAERKLRNLSISDEAVEATPASELREPKIPLRLPKSEQKE